MSVRPAGDPPPRTASRLVASVPWAVVGIGVGLLVMLLVLALSTFRGAERAAVPDPAPPMVFPSLPTTAAQPSTTGSTRSTSSVTASPSASASRRPTPRPSPTATRATSGGSGTVTVRYQVLGSDEDAFRAELSVRNGTGASRGWQVELRFTGNVEGVRVSSSAAISLTVRGTGWYVVRGGPLVAGASQTVTLRFTGSGAGQYPDQCTVEDGKCILE